MSVTVTSLNDAIQVHEDYDFVISILDKKTSIPNWGLNHLTVNFDDVEVTNERDYTRMFMSISRIINWVQNRKILPTDNVLVHCHAGISRSSAIAWTLLVMQGMPYQEAFDKLHQARPEIWPNLLVVDMADHILNLHGDFSRIAAEIDARIQEQRKQKWVNPQLKRGEL